MPAQRVDTLADGLRADHIGHAERFVKVADGKARYVTDWAKWITYEGGRWHLDHGDVFVTGMAKGVQRLLFEYATQPDLSDAERKALRAAGKRCGSVHTLAAIVRAARDLLPIRHTALNAHPELLNLEDGTLDLRTGALRQHRPEDLLTLQAPASFDPEAVAPTWEQCLATWQPDPAMRAYLQRIVGSGLTGYPVEYFYVNVGTGANGKSQFFGAIQRALGGYVRVPDKSLLVRTYSTPHETVKASLYGARLLLAPETEQGDALAEAQLKELSGGDRIKARRMREDEWAFEPTWTAFLHTNHKPRVRGTDEGTWRRLRIVPWTVTIPEGERRRPEELKAALDAERCGIINWLVAGARAFLGEGAGEPAEVRQATEEYRADNDTCAAFLEDRGFILDPEGSVTSSTLIEEHKRWCDDEGHHHERQWQRTTAALKSKGAYPGRSAAGRHWRGLRRS
jgi:putative DNA primase/helicase